MVLSIFEKKSEKSVFFYTETLTLPQEYIVLKTLFQSSPNSVEFDKNLISRNRRSQQPNYLSKTIKTERFRSPAVSFCSPPSTWNLERKRSLAPSFRDGKIVLEVTFSSKSRLLLADTAEQHLK